MSQKTESTESANQKWGPPFGEAEAAELIRWFICGDEQM